MSDVCLDDLLPALRADTCGYPFNNDELAFDPELLLHAFLFHAPAADVALSVIVHRPVRETGADLAAPVSYHYICQSKELFGLILLQARVIRARSPSNPECSYGCCRRMRTAPDATTAKD